MGKTLTYVLWQHTIILHTLRKSGKERYDMLLYSKRQLSGTKPRLHIKGQRYTSSKTPTVVKHNRKGVHIDVWRQHLLSHAKQSGFTSFEDWYSTDPNVVLENEAVRDIITEHKWSSFADMLMLAFPEHSWQPWKFQYTEPYEWWKSKDNQRKFLEAVRDNLGFSGMEGLYKITLKDLQRFGGKELIKMYNASVAGAVMDLYPDHDWQPWLFEKAPRSWWSDKEHQLQYIKWLADQLQYTKLDDYYKLNDRIFRKYKGRALLSKYGSVVKMMKSLFPDHDWQVWLFNNPSSKWFSKPEIQMAYLSWLRQKLKLHTVESLYSLTNDTLLKNNGYGFLKHYGMSIPNALNMLFPDHEWLPWRFAMTSNWWHSKVNQLHYVLWLSNELNLDITDLEQLYKISYGDFIQHHGHRLMQLYNASPYHLLSTLFPHHEWLPWRFKATPRGWWKKLANQRMYLNWLKTRLNYTTFEDFYKLTYDTLLENDGLGLVYVTKEPYQLTIKKVYSEHTWHVWKFENTPQLWWKDAKNQFEFLEAYRKHHNIQDLSHFYTVTVEDLSRFAGQKLHFHIQYVKDMVVNAYPDHPWLIWKFIRVPPDLWTDREVCQQFVAWLMKELQCNSLEDLYALTKEKLLQFGGRQLINQYARPIDFLRTVFPDHEWHEELFAMDSYQNSLASYVHELLPPAEPP